MAYASQRHPRLWLFVTSINNVGKRVSRWLELLLEQEKLGVQVLSTADCTIRKGQE